MYTFPFGKLDIFSVIILFQTKSITPTCWVFFFYIAQSIDDDECNCNLKQRKKTEILSTEKKNFFTKNRILFPLSKTMANSIDWVSLEWTIGPTDFTKSKLFRGT